LGGRPQGVVVVIRVSKIIVIAADCDFPLRPGVTHGVVMSGLWLFLVPPRAEAEKAPHRVLGVLFYLEEASRLALECASMWQGGGIRSEEGRQAVHSVRMCMCACAHVWISVCARACVRGGVSVHAYTRARLCLCVRVPQRPITGPGASQAWPRRA